MIKVKIKAIIFTIAAFAFAYLQGGNLPYTLFYGLAAVNVIGLISIITHRIRLFVDIKFNKLIFTSGESGIFSMHFYNNSFIPIPYIWAKNEALYKIDNKYNGDMLNLKFGGNKIIKQQVHFTKRGVFNFGLITLNLRDIFNVFETNKKLKQSVLIKVYPRIYGIEQSIIKGSDIFKNAVSNKSNIEDMYSSKDIRKYREGDNLKRINWKVSAKYNEIFVRDFDTVSGQEFNIYFDMNRINYDLDPSGIIEEKMVDFCSSLIHHMVSKEIKTNVYINASESEKFNIEYKNDFDKLMDYFLTEFSDSKQDFIKHMNSNIYHVSSLGVIGIITASISNLLTEELLKLKDRGYGVSVFYISASNEELKNIELLIRAGIECNNINSVLNE